MYTEPTAVESLQSYYSDYHKSLYGFRPRSASTEQWNDVEFLQARIDELDAAAPAIRDQENAHEQAAIKSFEKQIEVTIASGAKDRETAIRWLRDGEKDDGYFEYCNGLPYGYLAGNCSPKWIRDPELGEFGFDNEK